MPYGIRATLTGRHDQMRTGSRCWLQRGEALPMNRHLFLGIAPSGMMISFESLLSNFRQFRPQWFTGERHPRLPFGTRAEALVAAEAFLLRATQAQA